MTTCGPTVTIDNPNEPPQEIPSSTKLYKIPEEDSNKHPTCPPERGRVLPTLFKSKLFTYTSTTRGWCCCEWSTKTNNDLFSDAKCGELYPYTLETVTELIRNIDIQSLPVITNEVAIQLLKIQSSKFHFISNTCQSSYTNLSKISGYLDDHPYLCTSRFRHTLHQLPDDHHKILEQLCFQLHCILLNVSISGSAHYTVHTRQMILLSLT